MHIDSAQPRSSSSEMARALEHAPQVEAAAERLLDRAVDDADLIVGFVESSVALGFAEEGLQALLAALLRTAGDLSQQLLAREVAPTMRRRCAELFARIAALLDVGGGERASI